MRREKASPLWHLGSEGLRGTYWSQSIAKEELEIRGFSVKIDSMPKGVDEQRGQWVNRNEVMLMPITEDHALDQYPREYKRTYEV